MATINGTEGDDTLVGTSVDDTINGLGGNDEIRAGLGNDTIDGGDGNDQIEGGSGNDIVYDGAGDDYVHDHYDGIYIYGSLGNDTYVGGDADSDNGHFDVVDYSNATAALLIDLRPSSEQVRSLVADDAGVGIDTLSGIERIVASEYDDTIYGGDHSSDPYTRLYAGAGNDTIYGGSFSWIDGGDGDDYIEGRDIVYAGNGNDTVIGGDQLFGGAGDDYLDDGPGQGYMTGGAGNDTFIVDHVWDDARDSEYDVGIDTVYASVSYSLDGSSGRRWGIETLILTGTEAIDGTGNHNANTLIGNGAANTLLGLEGNDILEGGGGQDSLDGGEGSDLYVVRSAADHVTPEINDTGSASDVDEVRFASTVAGEMLVLNGLETGIERIVIGTGTDAVADTSATIALDVNAAALGNAVTIVGNDGRNRLYGSANADTLEGNDGNDLLNGGAGDDNLFGGDGNDRIIGDAGNDAMAGGAGHDTYTVADAGDTITELAGEGTDTALLSVSWTLSAEIERLVLTGSADIDGTGNDGANVLIGNAGANVLSGAGGNDTFRGGGGADTFAGGTGNDFYYILGDGGASIVEAAGEGNDLVRANVSHTLADNVERLVLIGPDAIDGTGNELRNALVGNAAANVLDAAGGNDAVRGGAGDDTLNGGTGLDLLIGGSGADIFLFDTALDADTNVDTLSDFSVADDIIHLDQTIFAELDLGTLSADAFHTGTSAQDADDRIIYDSSTGEIFYDGDGDGAGAAILFAQVNPGVALTHADFFVVA